MIAHKKSFYGGLGLLLVFTVVLIIMFSPIFKGQNVLEFLDSMYNSISKASAYYIPEVKQKTHKFMGESVSVTLALADENQAQQTAILFNKIERVADVSGSQIKITGDLGRILNNILADANDMFLNKGEKISNKYGYDERQVFLIWHTALKLTEKDLKKQKKFEEAKIVDLVVKKAVESSYNYYGIEPKKVSDHLGIVLFSLLFYVVYTLWYGFAILYTLEGWGLRLEH